MLLSPVGVNERVDDHLLRPLHAGVTAVEGGGDLGSVHGRDDGIDPREARDPLKSAILPVVDVSLNQRSQRLRHGAERSLLRGLVVARGESARPRVPAHRVLAPSQRVAE